LDKTVEIRAIALIPQLLLPHDEGEQNITLSKSLSLMVYDTTLL